MKYAGASPAAVPHGTDGEGRTRSEVVRLLTQGPAAAADIARTLGLTPAAVRRHLDHLTDEGAVCSEQARPLGHRGRGRPARLYRLTETGREKLPHGYDDLAVQALEFLDEHAGAGAVKEFARQRAQALVDTVRPQLDATPDLHAKVEILAQALSRAGFTSGVRRVGAGDQLCQHHCPVSHVAARFPQLCEAEFEVIAQALGTHTQRLATIARGDSFCTTFIPVAETVSRSPAAAATVPPSAPRKQRTMS